MMNGIAKPRRSFCSLWKSAAIASCLLAAVRVCNAQTVQPVQAPPVSGGDYSITQVGPHSRVWQNSAGQSVTEIATGMYYFDGQQWSPSENSFALSTDGSSFVANKIQDPTTLAANLNVQGAVTVTTPDNVTLRSSPVAIGFYDAASGNSVIVAALTNTSGVLVDAQHVVYSNAFVGGGFAASVVYSLPDTGSFHQDVVFTGFAPNFDPTVWGFDAASTNTLEIQIFTEFFNPPQPQVQERPLYIEQNPAVRASMVSPDVIDNFLDFGHYVFGPGRAYTTSTNAGAAAGVTVAKEFLTSNGRTFLVESLSYKAIATALQSLPPPQAKPVALNQTPRARRMKIAAADLPQLRAIKSTAANIPGSATVPAAAFGVPPKAFNAKPFATASSPPTPRRSTLSRPPSPIPHGVTVDYIVTVSSLNEPKIYSSDTTYFVSGNVYESS
jgi:hypothetical protein